MAFAESDDAFFGVPPPAVREDALVFEEPWFVDEDGCPSLIDAFGSWCINLTPVMRFDEAQALAVCGYLRDLIRRDPSRLFAEAEVEGAKLAAATIGHDRVMAIVRLWDP